MRKNAQVGDEITTIGGICGRIVAVKDEIDSIVIETGSDRSKMLGKALGYWQRGHGFTRMTRPEKLLFIRGRYDLLFFCPKKRKALHIVKQAIGGGGL